MITGDFNLTAALTMAKVISKLEVLKAPTAYLPFLALLTICLIGIIIYFLLIV